MEIGSKELTAEYYRRIRDRYPDLTLRQLEEVVGAPWQYLRREMESGRLESVRFKYLGQFRVYGGRARAMYGLLGPRLERGLITRDKHDRVKAALVAYMERMGMAPEAVAEAGSETGGEQ